MNGSTRRYEGKGIKLRIKDAFKEDAGRGIVRIDPETIENLNLRTGDVLEVSHPLVNKRSAALLYPDNHNNFARINRFLAILNVTFLWMQN